MWFALFIGVASALVLAGKSDLGWTWAILFGSGYGMKQLGTDRKIEEAKKTIEQIESLEEKHRKEVENVEKTDHTAHMSDADLIAHANERERERARTTIK